MNKENSFLKDCINVVSSLEINNESQAIAKEVVLDTLELLKEENKQLKMQLKQREEIIDEAIKFVKQLSSKGRDCMIYADVKKDILDKLQRNKGDNK